MTVYASTVRGDVMHAFVTDLPTAVDGIPFDVLGPSALAGIAVLLILTGRLVPRRTFDDKAHEADEWRAESRIKDQQIHELTEQNTSMLREFGPTVTALLEGIRNQASRKDSP